MTAEPGRGYWERHDASTRILSRPIPRMLELVVDSIRGGERVLEVAAGTGLVTTALATVAQEVIATDYAVAMVAKLAERVAQLANVRCERAESTRCPMSRTASTRSSLPTFSIWCTTLTAHSRHSAAC